MALLGLTVGGIYFFWENNKFGIIKRKIAKAFLSKSDSLYSIKYDSLTYNETKGEVCLKNISIQPDTLRMMALQVHMPYAALNVTIRSLTIKGVRTRDIINIHQLVGDSIIIDQPFITAYILRKIKKETKIDSETKELYRQILNGLKLIAFRDVFIRNAEVHAINLKSHNSLYELFNANIHLHDVRIDSLHREDTSRVLFCRDASFIVSKFLAFNNNRVQVKVDNLSYNGVAHRVLLSKTLVNRFDNDQAKGTPLVEALNFNITGINTQAVVNDKNIKLDSISCEHVFFYRPPKIAVHISPSNNRTISLKDTAGFRAAYGLDLKTIYLPWINIIDSQKGLSKNYSHGKLVLKIKEIRAAAILQMQEAPMDHIKEIDVSCPFVKITSADRAYYHEFSGIHLNSLRKELTIQTIKITPSLGEDAFANQAIFQKDRYDATFGKVTINNINYPELLKNKVVAGNLDIHNGALKIYRDLSKPLDGKSKVGNYPQQVLQNSTIPINIGQVNLHDIGIEYKEKNASSGKSGIIRFEKSRIHLLNVSNTSPKGVEPTATLETKVQGAIPLTATFHFPIGSKNGEFNVHGNIGDCDLRALNDISKNLALIEIDSGFLHKAEFDFTGDDNSSKGKFTMIYDHLRVSLLKKNAQNNLGKRGLKSFLANLILKNENPKNGKLRTCDVEYDREKTKSFFNLVWKTIFTGMKATVGMPMPKIR